MPAKNAPNAKETIVWLFRQGMQSSLTIAASLAQIGEFSFILAELGVSRGMIPERARYLVLGGAIVSIILNPFVFKVVTRMMREPATAVAA